MNASDGTLRMGITNPSAARAFDDARSERAIFTAVVEPLMHDLLAYFTRRVTPREDAAECLSETLVALWRHRHKMPASPLDQRRWAYGVARMTLANHARAQRRQGALALRIRDDLIDGPQHEPDLAERVNDALETLHEKDRELVRLIMWDGFGIAEAGALLHIRPGAARMRFARAKERLKRELHDEQR